MRQTLGQHLNLVADHPAIQLLRIAGDPCEEPLQMGERTNVYRCFTFFEYMERYTSLPLNLVAYFTGVFVGGPLAAGIHVWGLAPYRLARCLCFPLPEVECNPSKQFLRGLGATQLAANIPRTLITLAYRGICAPLVGALLTPYDGDRYKERGFALGFSKALSNIRNLWSTAWTFSTQEEHLKGWENEYVINDRTFEETFSALTSGVFTPNLCE
jgi:hypothetical protein